MGDAAASFVTNTNWQAYSGESTRGRLVQRAGPTVHNFVSVTVGIAVAAALIRGFTRKRTCQVGNFAVMAVLWAASVALVTANEPYRSSSPAGAMTDDGVPPGERATMLGPGPRRFSAVRYALTSADAVHPGGRGLRRAPG